MQQPHRQYLNPPIREAVCEFRFPHGPDTWDLSFPGLIYNELRASFPRRIQQEQPRPTFTFAIGNPQQMLGGFNPADPSQTLQFWKEEGDDGVITIAPNRIAISHYRPYPGWDKFRPVILQAHEAFLKVAGPRSIDRIGLRYLNSIDFHAENVALSNYFTYHPMFGPALPQLNLNVRMSSDFAYHDNRDIARLQLSTIPGEDQKFIAVSLDIDYFLMIPGSVQLNQTEEWLDQAHDAVRSIFEGTITDNARALFDH